MNTKIKGKIIQIVAVCRPATADYKPVEVVYALTDAGCVYEYFEGEWSGVHVQ